MHYIPLHDPAHVKLAGGAISQSAPELLGGRAIKMAAAGDGLSADVRGRLVGVVFNRTPWSGSVEVSVGGDVRRVELASDEPMTWVFEALVPEGGANVSVRLVAGQEAWVQGVYASGYATAEIPDLLRAHADRRGPEEPLLNQLTDVFKWYDREWAGVGEVLGCSPPYAPPDFVHRKSWEWAHCIYGLDLLGMLQPEYRALGVGVGWEPLSYFFSNYLADVVATDLYPEEGHWTESGAREGNPDILGDPDAHAPFPYARDRLRFMRMDGTRLEFPDASFDLVWSCSSIEHFGGHEGSARSMREIARVLRPGGVAAIITEYVLPDPSTGAHSLFDQEYFNLRCLYEYLVRPVPELRLVQPLDLSIPEYYVRRALRLPDEAGAPHSGSAKPHIVLRSPSGALHTSVAMFFRKEGGDGSRGPQRIIGQRAASKAASLPPAAALDPLAREVTALRSLPYPFVARGASGIRGAAQYAFNRVMGVVGRPSIYFGDRIKSTAGAIETVLRQQNTLLVEQSSLLQRLAREVDELRAARVAQDEE